LFMCHLFVKSLRRFVFCCAILTALLLPASPAFGAAGDPSCPNSPVVFDRSLFQKPIDATKRFDLKIVAIKSPDNNNLSLLYQAVYQGKVVAYNPTLVARVGDTIDFILQDCLTKKDIVNLRQFLPRQVADTPAPTQSGWFQVDQAEQVTPMGYSNFHSHGLAGKPTMATPGHPKTAAGDEVVGTFLSAVEAPSSDPTVANFQHYQIKVPDQDGDLSAQDDGLYWYHPHFHGESQQAVFLGLTGAIVVLPKGSSPIDPSAAGTVLVIRDRPISDTVFSQAAGGSKRPLVHTREIFLKGMGTPQAMDAAPKNPSVPLVDNAMAMEQPSGAGPAAAEADPACRLFDVPNGSHLCLPDNVTTQQTTKPQLTTVVTVNGTKTETPDTNDPNTVTHLAFNALGVQPAYPLRVLNASANTYLKLSLVAGDAPGGVDTATPNTSIQALPLTVFRRDGHKPPAGATFSDNAILLPPGSRVDFQPSSAQSGTVSLVSQYVNTGPAGDLVPYRLLAKISAAVPGAAPAMVAHAQAVAPPAAQVDGPTRYKEAFATNPPGSAGLVHRAFAFFEQDRACTPDGACGTSFYLIDITASKYGLDGHPRIQVTEAKPFMMPMKNGAMDTDRKDLFNGPGGRFNAAIPSVQVALHGQEQVNEIWEIYKFTAEYHAFHIHQLGFGVLQSCAPMLLVGKSADYDAVSGAEADENQEAKLLLDVINVPYAVSVVNGAGSKPIIYPGKVTLNVPFTKDIVGDFVLHCHLLEHEDNGMMLGIQVWKDDIPK
jgi:FtsP/CotA-like multicopper oxidase with cupredoxin domain